MRRCGTQGTHSILDISGLLTASTCYSEIGLSKEILEHFFEKKRPIRAVVEALVLHQPLWSGVEYWLKIGRRAIFGISDETNRFFEVERSKQELIEALLAQETIWLNIRQLIESEIEQIDIGTGGGKAVPLSLEECAQFFGSERPARAAVEAAFKKGKIWDCMRTNVGYYAIIYQDGTPQEIVFAGFSGD